MKEITQDQVRELFDYQYGNLYWKDARASNKVKSGDLAGHVSKGTGYRIIRINYRLYQAHRLVFIYHHGYLPEFLDHIDGDKLNNNINNIREATWSQNNMNQKKHKSMNSKPTSSKYKGVSWDKDREKWRSHITINGIKNFLGRFKSEIDAAKAYDMEAIEAFGEFAKPNFEDQNLYNTLNQ